jgi:hypothetical protein
MQGQTRSYVLTTLVTAPSKGDLTTLANIKDDLSLTSQETDNDNRLARYITEESAVIASYCNRVFGLATWQDEFRPQRGVWGEGVGGAHNPLKLAHYPLAANVVSFTGNTHSSALVDGLSTTTGLVVGLLISGPGIVAGTTIASVNAGASSLQLSTPATATTAAVNLSTGISIVETIAGTDTGLTAGVDFELDKGSALPGDEGASCLYRLNAQGNPKTWPAAKIIVVYQAGYVLPRQPGQNLNGARPVPPDLEGVCLRIVADRYRSKARDPMLVERNQGPALGSERYWVGSMPEQTGPYPNEIMAKLDRYRTPVVR